MRIELQRTQAPEDLGLEQCGICERVFEVGVVRAEIFAGTEADSWDGGVACPECVEYMGRHPSGRFPTITTYRRLDAEWRVPEYPSVAVLELAEAAAD